MLRPQVSDPCLAEPNPDQDAPMDSDQELTEKLDRCNSLLKPPPTEDQEIEEQLLKPEKLRSFP